MLKAFVHRVLDLLVEPFFRLYYRAKKVDDFDRVCFPFPHRLLPINCVGCFGCAYMRNPPFGQKAKGPYKVMVSEEFCRSYERLFGKGELVMLLYKLEKHNEEIKRFKEVK